MDKQNVSFRLMKYRLLLRIKRNELLTHGTTGMDTKNILLSECKNPDSTGCIYSSQHPTSGKALLCSQKANLSIGSGGGANGVKDLWE
jgi:hypothetical protein